MTVKKKRKMLLTLSTAAMAAVVGFGILASSSGAMMTHATASYSVAKNGGIYYSDYSSAEEQIKAGEELVKEIAGEGMVLLKNDGTLPLEGVKNVSIFGKNSIDPAYSGGGSGGAKGSQEKIDIYKAFEAYGFNCNPALKEFYETESRSGISRQTLTDIFAGPVDIGETAADLYDDALKGTFNAYNDCAFIVITRLGSEGSDNGTSMVMDHDGDASEKAEKAYHYNKLSKNETAMIKMVKEAGFKKIVAIINTPSAMELGALEDDEAINGIVWAGQPGYKGFYSLAGILTGEINPSGHLADTFMRDITKDPTFKNFGDGSQNSADGLTKMCEMVDSKGEPITVEEKKQSGGDNPGGGDFPGGGGSPFGRKNAPATGGTNSETFTMAMYEEGIYVGYKYYETKYQTVLEKSGKEAADAWYKEAVLYPFGYGLSYTTFKTELVKTTLLDKNGVEVSALDPEGDIKFEVKVTNEGEVKGKHVLELYYETPYIEGQVEKASKNLGAFAKTNELAPGESENVTLSLKVQRMASYDDEDKNNNNHKGYELDAGDYSFYISKDAHSLADGMERITYNLATGKTFNTDGYTNNEVKNRFEKGTTYASLPNDDSGIVFKPMTRAADATTGERLITPEAPTAAERTDKDGSITERLRHVFYLYELEGDNVTDVRKRTKADVVAEFGENYTQAATTEGRTFTNKFKDMVGVEKDDPRWNTLLNELTYAELRDIVLDGQTGTGANADLGKGATNDSDGPIGISQVMYPSAPEVAATWNTDLAHEQGRMVGDEGLWQNVNGWRGPGFNIHRSPFNGRNFEYYSEDGILTGMIGSEVVAGANSKGFVTWGKHLGLNEQESGRSGMMTFVSEQAMREIYFKGFQLVAELGHSNAFMTSMGRIGFVETYHNYAFNVELVKGEWGFDGTLITDALNGGTPISAKANKQAMAVSGQDIIMDNLPSENQLVYWGEWDPTKKVPVYTKDDGTKVELWSALYWLRVSARNMLCTEANSALVKNGVDTSKFVGTSFEHCVGYNVNESIATDTSVGKNARFEVISGSLPEGLSLSIDGVLSGTLTKKGNYSFTVKRYVDNWITSTANYTYNVTDTLAYSGSALDGMKVGTAFSGKVTSAITTADGYDSIGYQVAEDSALPDGLTLGEDGTISGTPTKAGTYNVVIEVVAKKTEEGSFAGSTVTNTYTYPQEFTMVVADVAEPTPDPEPTPVTPTETATSDYKGVAITGLVLGIIGAVAGVGALILNLLKKKKD